MVTKLKRGVLNLPPEEEYEPRWPSVTDMIENRLRELFLMGERWEGYSSTDAAPAKALELPRR